MVWSLLNERSSTPFALSGATAISIPSGFWIHPPSSIQLKSDEALTPVVRAKAIWSADNRAYISIDLGGPVYKPLKRLMHIVHISLRHRGPIICSDSQ
jgi:hypothetical protein